MKFKKMAGTCMEKKCSQKPSCEDACAAKAKAGAKDNCKKDDKECLAKFKKMAAQCVEEKCSGMVKSIDYRTRLFSYTAIRQSTRSSIKL